MVTVWSPVNLFFHLHLECFILDYLIDAITQSSIKYIGYYNKGSKDIIKKDVSSQFLCLMELILEMLSSLLHFIKRSLKTFIKFYYH